MINMKYIICGLCCSMLSMAAMAETHSNLQAVDNQGGSAWTGTFPFTIRGVITTPLDEMLDDTPNFLPWNDGQNSGKMGAEWEIFIQSIDKNDRGGSLLWLGQNYGNQPWIHDEAFSYTNEEWIAELQRVSTDPETGHVFQAGDYVEVTVRQSIAYGGKRNINEGHNNNPSKDFDIHLIQAGYGIPEPECISLSDLVEKNEDGQTEQIDIFDATRQSGGEYYQGIRVRIQGVQIATANGWDHTGTWSQRGENSITDGDGRFLKIRYPRTDLGNPPAGVFDAVGIINQESGSSTDGTRGYELFLQEIILTDSVPSLSISPDGYISWEDANGQWILETTSNLQNEWITSTEAVEHKDNLCIIKVSLDQGTSYFRLRKSN